MMFHHLGYIVTSSLMVVPVVIPEFLCKQLLFLFPLVPIPPIHVMSCHWGHYDISIVLDKGSTFFLEISNSFKLVIIAINIFLCLFYWYTKLCCKAKSRTTKLYQEFWTLGFTSKFRVFLLYILYSSSRFH